MRFAWALVALGAWVGTCWFAYEVPHGSYFTAVLDLGALLLSAIGAVAAVRTHRAVLLLWAAATLTVAGWMFAWWIDGARLHAACHADSYAGCSGRFFQRVCRVVHDCMAVVACSQPVTLAMPRCTADQLVAPHRRDFCAVGPYWLDVAEITVVTPAGFQCTACRL